MSDLSFETGDGGSVGEGRVELGVTSNVAEEPGKGEETDGNEGIHRQFNLLLDLIREKAGMSLHAMIEDGVVGDERKGEVEEEDSQI